MILKMLNNILKEKPHNCIATVVFKDCFGMRQCGGHTFGVELFVLTKHRFMKYLIFINAFQNCGQHIWETSETTLGGVLETVLQPADPVMRPVTGTQKP